jgi:hypothetical protein|tara:strand:+ start:1073 stop:1408 length:336 start_codon:yes stop_codon:yes gene_type:complete
MTNAQLVLDKIQETICTEDTTYEGRSGMFKFITGKTTAEGTVNGVVKKMYTGDDASVTWKTAGSFKVLVDGTVTRFTGIATKTTNQITADIQAQAETVAEEQMNEEIAIAV